MTGLDWSDVRITLQLAGLSTLLCIVFGLPLAWVLARKRFPGRDVLEVLVTLPLVLPPTVLGFYLLRGLGRSSPVGRFLEDEVGLRIVFTWYGGAIAAAILAAPLLIRAAQAAFEQVDPEFEGIAATLGRSPFRIFLCVTLPLSLPGVAAGVALAFARAAGEFGATVMVAGNIPGTTRSMSVAVYDAVQAGDIERANITALALLAISSLSLGLFHFLTLRLRSGLR
jgi:molybdate transport system permease protein